MKKYLVLPLFVMVCGCVGHEDSTDFRHSVCVSRVSSASVDSLRSFSGVVKEENCISLAFKTAGQISNIYVKEGDRVAAGQLLASLDDADYKLGVEALQIQYDQVSDEVNRARRLFEKKSMSANDYEKAEAGLRQLAVQLQVNKNKLDYTRLYAPVAGIIEAVNFSPAEMVDAGTSVFSLIDTGNMEVVCDVPARFFNERERFCSFSCTPSSGGGESCPLRLLGIVPKADGNQLYRIYLAFQGRPAAGITSGTNVDVTIGLAPESERTSVPAKAVFRKDGADCVWVLQPDSTVTARRVEVDRSVAGKHLAVISGLREGETVVRAGVSALHEGEKVRVMAEPSETNVGGEM